MPVPGLDEMPQRSGMIMYGNVLSAPGTSDYYYEDPQTRARIPVLQDPHASKTVESGKIQVGIAVFSPKFSWVNCAFLGRGRTRLRRWHLRSRRRQSRRSRRWRSPWRKLWKASTIPRRRGVRRARRSWRWRRPRASPRATSSPQNWAWPRGMSKATWTSRAVLFSPSH